MRRREYRRVVAIAGFDKLVEKPRRLRGDGKCRSAEAADGRAADVLQQFARRQGVLIKFSRRHLVDQAMEIAVRGNFVPGGDRVADEMRKSFAEIADHEAGGDAAAVGEKLQQA